ncbi:MAG: lipid-A-disaccharide synthase [Gammaproteobacteria bacterium]|nr:lipid-A-disaccharide synthase [Gammaproteobacteria bacterium]MDH5618146.1 lipid-A-disaccharide synthase [Gammaproteobacteria bacterium]
MRIGLVAGEASGDVLGAGLIRAIRARHPEATFEGVAGPEMIAAGCECWEPSESLAVMGLVEPLAHIPRLLRLRRQLAGRWTASPPDVFVGIDAPDFNLGLEIKLRKAGVRTVHYVSPSIWAWRAGRVRKVRKAADTVLCILPFEPALYAAHDVRAVFVGHPKAYAAPEVVDTMAARAALGLQAPEIVTVMPGSRHGEVQRLGGILAEAMRAILAQRPDVRFVTPVAAPKLKSLIAGQIDAAGLVGKVELLDGDAERAMSAADVVLQASGTAVLEAALLRKPTVATYRVASLTYLLVKVFRLVKLTHYTLPNLLTQEPLVPEFIQHDAQPEAIADAVVALLESPQRRQSISERFDRLRQELALDADQHAADAVLDLARR